MAYTVETPKHKIGRGFSQLKTPKRYLVEPALATIFINILSLALPLSMLQIYDRILPNRSYGTATVLVCAVFVAILVEAFLRYGRGWLLGVSASKFEVKASLLALEKIGRSNLDYVRNLRHGGILNSLRSISAIRDLYSGQVIVTLFDLPFAILFMWLVWYISGPLVLIPAVFWVLAGGTIYLLGLRLGEKTNKVSLAEGNKFRHIFSVFEGLITFKSQDRFHKNLGQFRYFLKQKLDLQKNVDFWGALLQELTRFVSQLTTISIIFVGALMVLNQDLTVGGLAASTILAGRAVAPISSLIGLRSRFEAARVARARVAELIEMPSSLYEDGTKDFVAGDISFEQAVMNYNGGTVSLGSLTFPKGSLVMVKAAPALLGARFMHAVGRVEVLAEGVIKINDTPIQEIEQHQFRSKLIYVPSFPNLFDGTLLDNLTMFDPSREAKVLELADKLGLQEVVGKLPNGMQTLVGEVNHPLITEGSIKKIAMIRAFSQDPEIVLMDAPFHGLDINSQKSMLTVLAQLAEDKIILINSQHKALMEQATHILSMSPEGSMVEKGRSDG